ncbi:radical SAM protein [Sorangium sp. So ce281]|uniref:B12-binding domain-containing radical SAM protein n=1 Tax=unclassified Sorangium TaxID=2621164 RepID=UPI003F632000
MHAILCVSGSSGESTVNHDAAGGIGCESPGREIRVFPPLTMLYIAAELRTAGVHIDFLDLNTSSVRADRWFAEDGAPARADALVLLSSLTTLEHDLRRVAVLRERCPHLFIVTVGTFYEHFAQQMLDAGADSVIYGTPELAIADCILNRRTGSIQAEMSPAALERLNYPMWDILDMDRYTSHTVLSSRGCSFGCGYCPYRVYQSSSVIARSPTNTLSEIAWLFDRWKPDYFLFRDPLFTFNLRRAEEIIGGIQSCAPGITWGCETRFELLPPSLIKLMGESGCHHVRLGLEAADPSVLASAGRIGTASSAGRHLERAAGAIAALKRHGILSVCFFMYGFPGDTEETANAMIEFVEKADPDVALLNYVVPYMGTPLHHEMHELGLVHVESLTRYGSKTAVGRTLTLDAERVQEIGARVQALFRARNRQFYPIR